MSADMLTKSPVYRPEAFSWSGFYVGAVAGAGIVTPQFSDHDALFTRSNWQAGDWAATVGGTVGYNWQWGSTVIGVEGDLNWTNFDRTLIHPNPDFGSQFDAKWNWFSTVRARFGLALDRTLVYATAGVAIVDLDYRVAKSDDGCSRTCATLSKTEVGLALGTGVEYALAGNWSFKAEYLFIKLPTKEVADPRQDATFQYTTDAHFARVGLNYRFDGPGARY